MKILLLSILICFQAQAELANLATLELRLSDKWRSFKEKRKSTPEYEALKKKTGNPSTGYDVGVCVKEKDFTACDMAYCISGSKLEATDQWLKAAQENINGTCYLPDIENDYRELLAIVKGCVNYHRKNGKPDPSCKFR
jgi:hypothetical protein